VSPSTELVASLRLLRDPARGALHLRWIEAVRDGLADLDLGPAFALAAPRGYVPDFLTPPPAGPLGRIEDELAQMRATPRAQVRAELRRFGKSHGRPAPRLGPLGPMVDALAAYWDRHLEPHWPRIRAFLQADLHHRARRLTEGGLAALFGDLHPTVRWHGDRLEVDHPLAAEVDLAGRGLLLVPSAFVWERPANVIDPPWQPTLVYPARGIATLWAEPDERDDGALDALLGATRARVLRACDAPRSTTDLARRLDATPGGVSQHLSVLRAAGLVSAERAGRSVLYARTARGDALAA
jgi:DNA-binding transcriptional ArsR family regulator